MDVEPGGFEADGGARHVETPGAAGGFVRGLAGLFMARFQSLDPGKW